MSQKNWYTAFDIQCHSKNGEEIFRTYWAGTDEFVELPKELVLSIGDLIRGYVERSARNGTLKTHYPSAA